MYTYLMGNTRLIVCTLLQFVWMTLVKCITEQVNLIMMSLCLVYFRRLMWMWTWCRKMRLRYVNLTSVILRTFLFLQGLPIVLSCIYLLNGWTPMSVANRTARADIVLSGHVIKAFKEREFRTEAMTYAATVQLFDVYKGRKLLRNIPVLKDSLNVYNISNFGDRKMCYADIDDGRNYIFFLTTYKQRLSAKYDDIFGASTEYTESNSRQVQEQVGQGTSSFLGRFHYRSS